MKVTGIQLFWMIATMESVMSIWLSLTPAILESKQDAWISILIGGVIGIAVTILVCKASLLYPNQTLSSFSCSILGKWLGRLIVLPYLAAWYSISAVILRDFSNFMHLTLFNKTPIQIISVFMVILMIYVTYGGGITGIGRCSEVIGPIIFTTFIIGLILSAGSLRWSHLLPVYSDTGWLSILKGSYTNASLLGESMMLLVLISFLTKPEKALTRSILGVGVTSLVSVIATLMVLMDFGPTIAGKMIYPFFSLVRTISILEFIQNIDIFVIFIWTSGVFIKLSLYLFITSYETAQLLHLKDWRKMIWFGSILIFILSIFPPTDFMKTYRDIIWSSWIFPICGFGIPLLLGIFGFVRKKKDDIL